MWIAVLRVYASPLIEVVVVERTALNPFLATIPHYLRRELLNLVLVGCGVHREFPHPVLGLDRDSAEGELPTIVLQLTDVVVNARKARRRNQAAAEEQVF